MNFWFTIIDKEGGEYGEQRVKVPTYWRNEVVFSDGVAKVPHLYTRKFDIAMLVDIINAPRNSEGNFSERFSWSKE